MQSEDSNRVAAALQQYQLRRLPRAAVVQGVARLASDMLLIYERFGNNILDVFSSVRTFCSSVGAIFAPRMMPVVLNWLYAPDLERADRLYTTTRMHDNAEYMSEAKIEFQQANAEAFASSVPEFREMEKLIRKQERDMEPWFGFLARREWGEKQYSKEAKEDSAKEDYNFRVKEH